MTSGRRWGFVLSVMLSLWLSRPPNIKGDTLYSLNDISTRLAGAEPGAILLLPAGTYSGEACVLSGKGLEGKPIVLQADPVGSVRFVSPVLLRADYVQLEGIVFEEGGSLGVEGAFCRISRCVWNDA